MFSNKAFEGRLAIVLYLVWFILCASLVVNKGTLVASHRDWLVISERSATMATPGLHSDTLYYRDTVGLDQGPAKAKADFGKKRFFFNENPDILLWFFLLASLSSISIAFALPLLVRLRESIRRGDSSRAAWVMIGVACMYCLALFLVDQGNPYTFSPIRAMEDLNIVLRQPNPALLCLQLPVLIDGILCTSGLLICARDMAKLSKDPVVEDRIANYRRLRNACNQYLLILGILVASGSVVTTSALRQAINGMFISQSKFELIPQEMVYIYSLMYTLFIVVVYVPVFYIQQNAGRSIVDQLSPMDLNKLEDWQVRKNILEEHLGLRTKLKESLSSALVVISPLVSALLSQLVGK